VGARHDCYELLVYTKRKELRKQLNDDYVFGADRTAGHRYWQLHGLLPAQNGWLREVFTQFCGSVHGQLKPDRDRIETRKRRKRKTGLEKVFC
jgi:hypothetical protein